MKHSLTKDYTARIINKNNYMGIVYNMGLEEMKNCKLSSSEKASLKKKKHQENLQKANPEKAAAKKEKADSKRARRKESGSTKEFK